MPNDLLYISWPLLLILYLLWTFPNINHQSSWRKDNTEGTSFIPIFFKLPHTRTARRILFQTPQTQTIPALAATWALYYHWPRSLTNGVAAFPPDSINLKDKYPSGRTRFNSSTRPNSASRRFQSLPSQDQHQNMKKISQCSETLPHHPFSKAQSMASFPQNSQVDASHFR